MKKILYKILEKHTRDFFEQQSLQFPPLEKLTYLKPTELEQAYILGGTFNNIDINIKIYNSGAISIHSINYVNSECLDIWY